MKLDEYQFGDFILKKNKYLKKNSNMVFIPPKELNVLSCLVENAGEIVEKEKIIDAAWDGGMVSDESLTRCIYVIRKLLGENKYTKYIKTLYGKGYVFSHPLSGAHAKELVSGNYLKSAVVYWDGSSIDFKLSDVYDTLMQYIPETINVFPHIIENEDDLNLFLEGNNPEYIFYCSQGDSGKAEFYVKAISCDSMTGFSLGFFSLDDEFHRNDKLLSENINKLFLSSNGKKPCNNNQSAEFDKTVEGLMNIYSTESLLQAANLILTDSQNNNDSVVGMLQVAECYFGIFMNESIKYKYKALHKMRTLAENVLFSDPLNASALAIMGLIKTLNHDHSLSSFYFSQSRKLTINEPNQDVDFYYACCLYFKSELDIAMELLRSIESNGENSGRTKLLKNLILNNRNIKLTDEYFTRWDNNIAGRQVLSNGYKKNRRHTMFNNHVDNDPNVIIVESDGNKNFTARIGELKSVSTLSIDVKDDLHWL